MKKSAMSYAERTQDAHPGFDPMKSSNSSEDDSAVVLDRMTDFAGLPARLPAAGVLTGDGEFREFRAMLEVLPAAIYATDAEGWITFFNEAAVAFWGLRPQPRNTRWCGAWRLRQPDGTPLAHDQSPLAEAIRTGRSVPGQEMIAERPDGTLVPFIAYPSLLRDTRGDVCGAVNMLVDITERKQADLHQKTLVDELNHRVKNMLATVQSLAIQTIRSAGVGREVLRAFDGRLFALGRVHDLLTLGQWQTADFKAVVEAVLKPFETQPSSRIFINGGSVQVAPREAVLLAMVLHELASNALKYGALSDKSGTLSVVWREAIDDDGRRHLHVAWQEANGPDVVKPERQGFGTRLIERGITSELKGAASISYDPGGVHCSICIPLTAARQ